MEQIRIEIVLEAVEPIAHSSETTGNAASLMQQKIIQQDGSVVRVPIVTGDTMRHGLREAGSYALLSAAGMLNPKPALPEGDTPAEPVPDEGLSEATLRLLFAGGMVTGASGGSVKLDEFREMMELVPTLALLGGCAQNRVIPGQIEVSPAVLICEETVHGLPEWVVKWMEERGYTLNGSRAHVEQVQRVRMDPTLSPEKRNLLSQGERNAVEGRLIAREAASDTGDAVEKEETKASMMPFTFQTIARGSLLMWTIDARLYSPLDRDTLLTMLGVFCTQARVGGKKGTGHGRIKPVVARLIEIEPFHERSEGLALRNEKPGKRFLEHVSSRAPRVKEFLAKVSA